MAAKFLHTLADENQDLQTQIGCMTGIYQMFDRQLLVTSGSRHVVDRSSKRLLTSGNGYLNGGNLGDNDEARLRSTSLEKSSHKTLQERQRLSIESSRASFTTSSRSSSFSSLDWNPAAQLEQVSSNKRVFSDNRDSQQSLDLRDLVKDSMYREVESLSIKSKKAAGIEMKERMHADDERRDLLSSFSYHSKDGSSSSISNDAPPRFSYDGREVNRTSYSSSRDVFRPSFPRYSLDSTESSSKSLNTDLKSNFLLKKSTGKDNNKSDEQFENVKETQGKNQARLPSVVARLMGLETLPDSGSLNKNSVGSSNSSSKGSDHVRITSPLEKTGSRNNLLKEPSSPRWKSPDGSMKPLVRFPLEPAPWKQSDKARIHQKSGSGRNTKDSMKDHAFSPSVYNEIDKRLKELEFLESGKDLRDLKQIMEAIQSKELLETPEEGEGSNFSSHKGQHGQKLGGSSRRTDQAISSTAKKFSPSTSYDSPIVIMKPAKLVEKYASVIKIDGLTGPIKLKTRELNDDRKCSNSGERDSVVESAHMKNVKNTKITLLSKRQQLSSKDGNNGVFGKSSGSVSPRMEQKKLDMEKRSRPPTSPNSVKSKPVQPNKKQEVSKSSSVRRRRPKDTNPKRSDDQLSESSIASSNSSYSEIEDSVQSSESSVHCSRSSEVSSSRRSQHASMGASQSTVSGSVKKKSNLILRVEESTPHVCVPPAYSSPVSVLENIDEYKDSSPYPKKHIRKIPQDESRCNEEAPAISQQCSEDSSVSIGINRKKLENIDNLVQKLRKLNSGHDEANTDYIASLCDNTDPVHRYVSEILLASGLLLRDFGSNSIDIQFHHSGYPLNPELFLVLEQTKARKWLNQECLKGMKTQLTMNEKFHRKLIFDTVNDILARKLSSFACPTNSDPCPRPVKLARTSLNAQKLLRELCSEIEGLQNKNAKCNSTEEDEQWKAILSGDVMHRSEKWINFDIEISGIVLHIERLVFKDLVKEIVLGEIDGSKSKSSRRKLFSQ